MLEYKYSQILSRAVSSGSPKMTLILDIQFGLLCWGIKLIISNQHHNFRYRMAKNLGTTNRNSISNVKCNSTYGFLLISFDTGTSCHWPLVCLTVALQHYYISKGEIWCLLFPFLSRL